MKTLDCRDVGFDCEGQIRGETEQEILTQAAEHVRKEHNIPEVTPGMDDQLRRLIREEDN